MIGIGDKIEDRVGDEWGRNWMKLDEVGTNWNKLEEIGGNWRKLVETGGKSRRWGKLDEIG